MTRGIRLHKNSAPASGLYTCGKTLKNVYKIRIQRDLFETCTNWQSDKGFLLTSKVSPQWVFCPSPGAIYIYKIIKNVHKIRFRRDHFGTCTIWTKRKGLSVVLNFLSPVDCLPLPGAIYMWKKTHKNGKNQASKKLNWQQMGKVKRNFCWHQNFVPKRLSVPALGLYTCIKSFKMCLKSYFKEIVLKLATNGQSDKGFLLTSTFVPKGLSAPALGL